ncbi:MAG: TrbG/VirB9 family P-type conjugative transfer protein [Caulobacterales bacterium]|jgi:type IV secretion system protein VirB9
MISRLLALLLIAAAPGVAVAQPASTSVDKRIRTVPYSENAIVTLVGRLGFQTVIEFDPAERIENVSIGDSIGWQVTPNRRATLLFLKPVEASATNMTVVTTLRRYVFDLRVTESEKPTDGAAVYVLRFKYPPPPPEPVKATPPPPPPPPPPVLNTAYSQKGSAKIAPSRIWDDGRFTYFEFPDRAEPPAVAAIGPDGREGLINFRFEGRIMVVDVVAPAFVLRHGKEKLTVVNDAAGSTRMP